MRKRKEAKTYVIYTEVKGYCCSPVADMCVSMAEVTPEGDRDLDHPDQCESLAAYLAFDRIVKTFEPDAGTAVDTVSEMLALSALEAMVQDNEIVFPRFPSARWMANVLVKYPRLTDKAAELVKAALKEDSKATLYTDLAEYLHTKMEPEDYAELAESALKEMSSKFPPYEGSAKHEINSNGGSIAPKKHKHRKTKEKNDE